MDAGRAGGLTGSQSKQESPNACSALGLLMFSRSLEGDIILPDYLSTI